MHSSEKYEINDQSPVSQSLRSIISERALDIASHMVGRIESCLTENHPFQHVYLENVFPDGIYAEIRKRLPIRDCYVPFNIKKHVNDRGESTRDMLFLSQGGLNQITEDDKEFWQDILEALHSSVLQQAIYQKFADDISIRLECDPLEVKNQESWVNTILVRDFENYELKPHPDGHPRVVTLMFYLAEDDSHQDLGTSLYKEVPLLKRPFYGRFKEIKRAPYRPNSCFAFAVNDSPLRRSWHGRELITAKNVIRDSIIVEWLYNARNIRPK